MRISNQKLKSWHFILHYKMETRLELTLFLLCYVRYIMQFICYPVLMLYCFIIVFATDTS